MWLTYLSDLLDTTEFVVRQIEVDQIGETLNDLSLQNLESVVAEIEVGDVGHQTVEHGQRSKVKVGQVQFRVSRLCSHLL